MQRTWRRNIFSSFEPTPMIQVLLVSIVLIGITISANEAFAWTITADFESGTVGNLAKGTNAFSSTGNRTTFSNAKAHSGSQSAKMEWRKGGTGFSCCTGEMKFPQDVRVGQEIWGRAYFYFQSPWSWDYSDPTQAHRVKIFRFHQKLQSGKHVGYNDIHERGTAGRMAIAIEGMGPFKGLYNGNKNGKAIVPIGQWVVLELYVLFHPTNGAVRMWIDGTLKADYSGIQTAKDSNARMDFNLVMSYWNGGAPQNQVAYIDDVIITTDTPTNKDAAGNRMIGSAPHLVDATPPNSPTGLTMQ